MSNNAERLIVALDLPTTEQAMKAVDTLGDAVCHYKIGMESFYGMGTHRAGPDGKQEQTDISRSETS